MSNFEIGPLLEIPPQTEVCRVRPEQTANWAKYRRITLESQGTLREDLSFSVLSNGETVAWCYCFLRSDAAESGRTIVSNGGNVVSPAVRQPLGTLRAETINFMLNHLRTLCLSRGATADVLLHAEEASLLLQALDMFPSRNRFRGVEELIVDLDRPLPLVWGDIRRSYRPLIRSERWNLDVSVSQMQHPSDELAWSEVRALHERVSGRVTRSGRSWHAQYEAIRDGGLVVLVRHMGVLVGASAVEMGRGFAEYGTGIYDRELMSTGIPLGHKAQWAAIESLHSCGVKKYSLGMAPQAASAKERGILNFKTGFARERNRYVLVRIGERLPRV